MVKQLLRLKQLNENHLPVMKKMQNNCNVNAPTGLLKQMKERKLFGTED